MPKQISILGGAGVNHFAVAEHYSHATNCWCNLARCRIDSVSIYTKRPTNAEDIDRLHGLHRQPLFIEQLLHLPPTSPRLHIDRLVPLVEAYVTEIMKVEHQPAMSKRLAAHA